MSTCVLILAIKLGLLGADGQFQASIAEEYALVVADLKRAASSPKEGTNSSERASPLARTRLRALIDRGEAMASDQLSCADCNALCECAERLKDTGLALKFARMSVAVADDARPYVALVRCLCSAQRLGEAEDAARDASERFPGFERLYLLQNLLALKYADARRPGQACDHLVAAIEMVCQLVDRDPFYVPHLSRCLQDLHALAGHAGAEKYLSRIDSCRSAIQMRFLTERRRMCGASILLQRDLRSARLLTTALITINRYSTSNDGEAALVEWGDFLIASMNLADSREGWLAEVNLLITECARSCGPDWEGDRLKTMVARLKDAVKGSATGVSGDGAMSLPRRIDAVYRLVSQHCRLRGLVGSRLPIEVGGDQRTGNDGAETILHISYAASPAFRDGVRAAARQFGDHAAQARTRLEFVLVIESGGLEKEGTGATSALKEVEQRHRDSLGRLRTGLGVAEEFRVTPAAEFRKLGIRYFPVNVLVDRSGLVIAVATGPEEEKIADLRRLAAATSGRPHALAGD